MTNTNGKQMRQGDVLLVQVSRVPKTAKRQDIRNEIVLAYGEATGHAHTVDATKGTLSLDERGVMFLTVEELTKVRHQEHAPLTLEPATYKVIRQREYTPEALRNVAD